MNKMTEENYNLFENYAKGETVKIKWNRGNGDIIREIIYGGTNPEGKPILLQVPSLQELDVSKLENLAITN